MVRRRSIPYKSGGAWKVAFADFMISMMAFFLVLWIVEASSLKQRKSISEGLNAQSVFEKNGGITNNMDENALSLHQQQANDWGEALNVTTETLFESKQDFEKLSHIFSEFAKTRNLTRNIELQPIAAGLKVSIRDDTSQAMFLRGGSEITPFFYDRLSEMADIFKWVKNAVLITGHTDANPYPSNNYSNWELSGERALAARKALVNGGMPSSRLNHISAYAATQLVNVDNPFASDNRRVELIILTPKAQQFLQLMFQTKTQSNQLNAFL